MLDRRRRQRAQHRDLVQHGDVGVALGHAPVQRAERGPRRGNGRGPDEPEHQECAAAAEQHDHG
jgi:hypothetical protein